MPPTNLRRIDPKIWRACAGSSVQVPAVDSRVYYFPQGHLEQSSSSLPPILSPLVLSKPLILCRIAAVDFLADPQTDEVFAKLVLHPLNPQLSTLFRSPSRPCEVSGNRLMKRRDGEGGGGGGNEGDGEEEQGGGRKEDKIVSFAKILTPSDANNGGGFSVPRFCADSIFPPLNYEAEPPVQTLSVTDVHGFVWDFRHIYRGTPRRHLLTTGWSKFVNHKKLVAGDSVVFMRNMKREMFVGVRRAVRSTNSGGDCSRWSSQFGGGGRVKMEEAEGCNREGSMSRSGRGRLSAEAIAEAAELAAQDLPFEVVYYPRVGWSDFVVKAELVEESLKLFWSGGMRVKMAMETDDSSRMTWFQGTLSSATPPDKGPWRGSPWRMLQVSWDEPEVLQNAKRVSPWQVEFVASTPPLQTCGFHPAKRFRAPLNSGLLTDGDGEVFSPMSGAAANSTVEQLNTSLLSYNTFPAGMQGARQELFSVSSLSNLLSETTQMCAYNSFGNNVVPKLKTVSTELNIGSSQSDNLSPDSQSSVHSFGTELVGNQFCNPTKVGKNTFQLFGQIIHVPLPVENGFDDVGCTNGNGIKGYSETEGMNNSPKLSFTKLLERIDVQCSRASAIEACYL